MLDVADPRFRERLASTLNEHEGFGLETRWFDGSILLEIDDRQCWLKVYRGRVLDALDHTPPFGFTFKLCGAAADWQSLVDGRRLFADLITPGRRDFKGDPSLATADAAASPAIRIEGNRLEASRLHEALFHLAESVARVARGG